MQSSGWRTGSFLYDWRMLYAHRGRRYRIGLDWQTRFNEAGRMTDRSAHATACALHSRLTGRTHPQNEPAGTLWQRPRRRPTQEWHGDARHHAAHSVEL